MWNLICALRWVHTLILMGISPVTLACETCPHCVCCNCWTCTLVKGPPFESVRNGPLHASNRILCLLYRQAWGLDLGGEVRQDEDRPASDPAGGVFVCVHLELYMSGRLGLLSTHSARFSFMPISSSRLQQCDCWRPLLEERTELWPDPELHLEKTGLVVKALAASLSWVWS